MRLDHFESLNRLLRDDEPQGAASAEDSSWKGRRIRGSPIRRLPDCRSFKIELNGWDQTAAEYGLDKKIPPTIEIERYQNRSINRYLEHQVIRMEKAKAAGQQELFWRIGFALLKRSNAYMVSGMHRVMENWHRRYKFASVLAVVKEARAIANGSTVDIEYERLYIPKANGKSRPLGVPTMPWRLYLHLLNNILVMGLGHKLHKSQHGFQPGKGTMTAWKEVLTEIINKRNIYEFDLKNFFPSVRRQHVYDFIRADAPAWVIDHLRVLNESDVKLQDPRLWHLDESVAIEQMLSKTWIKGQRKLHANHLSPVLKKAFDQGPPVKETPVKEEAPKVETPKKAPPKILMDDATVERIEAWMVQYWKDWFNKLSDQVERDQTPFDTFWNMYWAGKELEAKYYELLDNRDQSQLEMLNSGKASWQQGLHGRIGEDELAFPLAERMNHRETLMKTHHIIVTHQRSNTKSVDDVEVHLPTPTVDNRTFEDLIEGFQFGVNDEGKHREEIRVYWSNWHVTLATRAIKENMSYTDYMVYYFVGRQIQDLYGQFLDIRMSVADRLNFATSDTWGDMIDSGDPNLNPMYCQAKDGGRLMKEAVYRQVLKRGPHALVEEADKQMGKGWGGNIKPTTPGAKASNSRSFMSWSKPDPKRTSRDPYEVRLEVAEKWWKEWHQKVGQRCTVIGMDWQAFQLAYWCGRQMEADYKKAWTNKRDTNVASVKEALRRRDLSWLPLYQKLKSSGRVMTKEAYEGMLSQSLSPTQSYAHSLIECDSLVEQAIERMEALSASRDPAVVHRVIDPFIEELERINAVEAKQYPNPHIIPDNVAPKDFECVACKTAFEQKQVGFPQGSPTSPFLSLLALEETVFWYYPEPGDASGAPGTSNLFPKGGKTIMYADDGLYADDNVYDRRPRACEIVTWDGDRRVHTPVNMDPYEAYWQTWNNMLAFDNSGVQYAPEKSGWVKQDGKWLKPLKFLGLIYDGEKDRLEASTRNGSTLVLSEEVREWMMRVDNPAIKWGDHFIWNKPMKSLGTRSPGMSSFVPGEIEKIRETLRVKSLGLTWEQLVKSSVLGFVLSRLYIGDWNVVMEQQFDLTFKEGSWLEWWNEHVTPENKRRTQAKLAKYPQSPLKDKGRGYVVAKSSFCQETGIQLSVFNSTSVAAKSLLNILRYRSRVMRKSTRG